MNKRLVSSLFLRKLDAEELDSAFAYDISNGSKLQYGSNVSNYPSISTYKIEPSKKVHIDDDHNEKKTPKALDKFSTDFLSQNEVENYFGLNN